MPWRWRRSSSPQHTEQPESDRSAPRIRERLFNESDVPRCALPEYGAVEPREWQNAVFLYIGGLEPSTGKPWNDAQPSDQVARNTLEQGVAACQADGVLLSGPDDEESAELSADAAQQADEATSAISQAEAVLDKLFVDADGGQSPAREVIAEHLQDQVLAEERVRGGDTRHTQAVAAHGVIVVPSILLALADLLLLWKPILGLGSLSSGGMIWKWAVGGALAGFVALVVERSVWHYRMAERESVDRRAALADCHRALGRGRWTSGMSVPSESEIAGADRRVVVAHGWLAAAAGVTGVGGAMRIAILAASGNPVVLSGIYGAIGGVFLFAAVVLLSYWACRGNHLGDRIRQGGELVERIGAHYQRFVAAVQEHRDHAYDRLAEAEKTATAAVEIRERVAAQYWQAMLMCWRWAGFDRAILEHPGQVVARSLPIVEQAEKQRESARVRIDHIDKWLREQQPTVARVAREPLALPAGQDRPPSRVLVKPPPLGSPGGLINPLPDLPAERSSPLLGLAVSVVLTVLAGGFGAWVA